MNRTSKIGVFSLTYQIITAAFKEETKLCYTRKRQI